MRRGANGPRAADGFALIVGDAGDLLASLAIEPVVADDPGGKAIAEVTRVEVADCRLESGKSCDGPW